MLKEKASPMIITNLALKNREDYLSRNPVSEEETK